MTKDEFLAKLPHISYFSDAVGGIACHFRRTPPARRGGPADDGCFVSDNVLSSVHPDLPDAARHMLTHVLTHEKDDTVAGVLLEAQLAYFTRPCVVEPEQPYLMAFGLQEVRRMNWTGSGDAVFLEGTSYHLTDCLLELDESVTPVKRFVSMVTTGSYQVPTAWLDARYPGWRDRYAAAIALECDDQMTVDHVFSDSIQMQPAVLPTTVAEGP